MGRGAQHRVGKPGLAQDACLRAVDLLGAEIRRVDVMRVDQDHAMAGASEHGGRGRAGKPAARDDDVGLAHGVSSMRPKR